MADVNSWLKGDSLILVPPTLQHDFLAVSGRTAILFRLEVLDALNLITETLSFAAYELLSNLLDERT